MWPQNTLEMAECFGSLHKEWTGEGGGQRARAHLAQLPVPPLFSLLTLANFAGQANLGVLIYKLEINILYILRL